MIVILKQFGAVQLPFISQGKFPEISQEFSASLPVSDSVLLDLQVALQLIQSSSLSASYSRLLLQITSSLLLGENVSLPSALIQETVEKVSVLTGRASRELIFTWSDASSLSLLSTRCLAAQ